MEHNHNVNTLNDTSAISALPFEGQARRIHEYSQKVIADRKLDKMLDHTMSGTPTQCNIRSLIDELEKDLPPNSCKRMNNVNVDDPKAREEIKINIIKSISQARRRIVSVAGEMKMFDDDEVANVFETKAKDNLNQIIIGGPIFVKSNSLINKSIWKLKDWLVKDPYNVCLYYSPFHQPSHYRLIDDFFLHLEFYHDNCKIRDCVNIEVNKDDSALTSKIRNSRLYSVLCANTEYEIKNRFVIKAPLLWYGTNMSKKEYDKSLFCRGDKRNGKDFNDFKILNKDFFFCVDSVADIYRNRNNNNISEQNSEELLWKQSIDLLESGNFNELNIKEKDTIILKLLKYYEQREEIVKEIANVELFLQSFPERFDSHALFSKKTRKQYLGYIKKYYEKINITNRLEDILTTLSEDYIKTSRWEYLSMGITALMGLISFGDSSILTKYHQAIDRRLAKCVRFAYGV